MIRIKCTDLPPGLRALAGRDGDEVVIAVDRDLRAAQKREAVGEAKRAALAEGWPVADLPSAHHARRRPVRVVAAVLTGAAGLGVTGVLLVTGVQNGAAAGSPPPPVIHRHTRRRLDPSPELRARPRLPGLTPAA